MKNVRIFFLLLVIVLVAISQANAGEYCEKGPFCLEIEKVLIDNEVVETDITNYVKESFFLHIACLCHKWRNRAHNLHVSVRIKRKGEVYRFKQRRLISMSSGENAEKILEFNNLPKGEYILEIVFKDLISPISTRKNFEILVI